ncbi:carotenoid oxygenase [Leptodontidium sp. 2 PMI_412]|nr:carotenoid oxygenase [Leptodontidium sp. 2 PMI_412]
MANFMADVEKRLPVSQETRFPDAPFYTGSELPCRFEAEVYNCVVRGQIPKEIDGTYYRVMDDALWGPLYNDDVFINGDGCVNAIRLKDGHADFKMKHVRTEKFCIERAARQAVFGKYRNRYTDDPRVKHAIHSTANVHVIYWDNQLLALKEDSLPYALDPDTLNTNGYYDFHGQYTAPTFTAHPKIDMSTGELVAMGYQAKGDTTTDVVYYLFDKNGKKLEECWLNAPYVGMMHDMAASDKWIVFCLTPLEVVPLDLLKAGHKHFAWNNEKPLIFGILPRRNPKPEDVRWFENKNAFLGHTGNAFDGEDGCVYLDAPLTYGNKFWFFPPIGGDPKINTTTYKSHYVRWKLDPNATDRAVEPQELVNIEGEMPRLDDRYLTKSYNKLFMAMTNKLHCRENAVIGGTYNSLAALDLKTGKYKYWMAGPDVSVHEIAFVPRHENAAEGDGYLLSVANRRDIKLSNIVVLDSRKIEEGPIAIIELPFRLRAGIHGSWVPASQFKERKDLCDMSGVTEEIRKQFEGITVKTPFPSNRSAGNAGNDVNGKH